MPENITGELTRILYHEESDGYTVGLFVTTGHAESEDDEVVIPREFKAIGRIHGPLPGSHYELEGSWRTGRRDGEREFAFGESGVVRPTSPSAVVDYLVRHAPGVGKTTAEKLVESFGDKALDVLIDNPEWVVEAKIRGLNDASVLKITDALSKIDSGRKLELAMTDVLGGTSVNSAQRSRILGAWGGDSPDRIRTNPYGLTSIRGIGFRTADSVAMKLGFDPQHPARVRHGIRYTMTESARHGHTCVEMDSLTDGCMKDLGLLPSVVMELIRTSISEGRLVEYGGDLYLPEMFAKESLVAQRVDELLLQDVEVVRPNMVEGLDDDQMMALETAGMFGLSLLTGAPGTGKSYTLGAMVRMFSMAGMKVGIAAPTGKAARRITELTGHAASTIHKILDPEYDPRSGSFSFTRDETRPLEFDVLVVDECSMMDVELAADLLKAVRSGTRLVLVGDNHQLSPVGPGTLLLDLLKSEIVPRVELSTIKRQKEHSMIVKACHSIKDGKKPKIDNKVEGNDLFAFKALDEDSIRSRILELVTERIPNKFGASLDDIQVISPVRDRTSLSVKKLNSELRKLVNPDGMQIGKSKWRVGDRVINRKNSYRLGIMNGDVGRIIGSGRGCVVVGFAAPDRTVDIPHSENNLQLAYAITCHSAQGSEYPFVVIPMFTGFPTSMLSRAWLYTAISRASRACILVGETGFISECVRQPWKRSRKSNLLTLLREKHGV